MKKDCGKHRRKSYALRAIRNHPQHEICKKKHKEYAKKILETKKAHWAQFLNTASEHELWISNKYLKAPVGDGGRPHIPTINRRNPDGTSTPLDQNEEKAAAIADSFFPPKPPPPPQLNQANNTYPTPLRPHTPLTRERVARHIKETLLNKAPGPDGIPNIVLQQCATMIVPILTDIFAAAIDNRWYYKSWKESITCVLKKPGKLDYTQAKAYRPIALLATITKILAAIIAEDMTRLIKLHQLLPANHFGGRPG